MALELTEDFQDDQVGGKFVKNTGIHKVKLVRVGFKVNKTGSKSIVLTLNNGSDYDDTLYLGVFEGKDGKAGYEFKRILAPLASFLGLTGKAIEYGKETIKGKSGPVEIDVITTFKEAEGKEFMIAVQEEVNTYNNKILPNVLGIFNKDGYTATELKAGSTNPTQIEQVRQKLDYSIGINKQSKPDVDAAKAAIEAEAEDVF